MKVLKLLLAICTCLISGGCSSINLGGGEPKLTGIYGELNLYEDNQYKPIIKKDNKYICNTFLTFALTIYPQWIGSKSMSFVGDICEFGQDNHNYYIDYFENGGETTYLIYFYKQGNYIIDFSYLNFSATIDVICDDEDSSWENYYYGLNEIYPWINDIKNEDVNTVRIENGYNGVAPGSLIDIYYSYDKDDIATTCTFLKNKVVFIDSIITNIAGGYYYEITYYYSNTEKSIRISNGYIYIHNKTYRIIDEYPLLKFKKSEHRYSFVDYQFKYDVFDYQSDSIVNTISNLNLIEFIIWPTQDIYDEIAPVYVIKELIDFVYIYSKNRFSYMNTMYQIKSEYNFSCIF